MKKIQQFIIYKFSTNRLKETNYKIKNISIEQARKNDEIISISNSQMVRAIRKVANREFSESKLSEMLEEKRLYTKKKNSKSNREKIGNILRSIDEYLFIPEIISIKFSDKRHYEKILRIGGIKVNGENFVPFLFSAGLIRRNSGLFIREDLKSIVNEILDNGRNKNIPIVPAKINSYFGLYSSSSLPVSTPRILVVPDLILKKVFNVDFGNYVQDGVDPKIDSGEKELEFNFFDGCGLISPSMAYRWKEELELDYLPSNFIVRSSWLKGMVVTMDFHRFAKEEACKNVILDAYGKEININDVDVIVSPSMFKLWDSYLSIDDYVRNCEENSLGWSVSRVNPKKEKSFCKTSYQFLQVLNIKTEEQIKSICQPTLEWINNAGAGNISSTILYLLGESDLSHDKWFDRLEPVYKTLFLDNEFLNDAYLISHIDKSLSKKKKDSKKGNLILRGNYQAIIPDPLLYCRYIFGMELIPTLNSGECYSKYWNDAGVKRVAGIRSPIVYESEVLDLKVVSNNDTEKWFDYISSGIIVPANGVSLEFMLAGGADGDGDLIATIDSPEILESRFGGLPITYDLKKPEKIIIDDLSKKELWDAQIKGLGTRVGFFTNVSSSFYTLIHNFPENSLEYETIKNRLKWGRCLQGLEIDRQKGLIIPPFPEHWTKYKKVLNDGENFSVKFNNSILIDKRPYFFVYLYDSYMRKYKKEKSKYDNICQTRYYKTFDEIYESKNRTQEQEDVVNSYKKKTFFIKNQSVMNRICYHMEKQLKDSKTIKTSNSKKFDYTILLSKSFKTPSKIDIDKVKLLYREYKSLRRNIREKTFNANEDFHTFDTISSYIRNKAYSAIENNSEKLGDLMVFSCYKILGNQSKNFLWGCFGNEVFSNVKNKKNQRSVRIPLLKQGSSIKYLYEDFSNFIIDIGNE